jgi:hypothetical protein
MRRLRPDRRQELATVRTWRGFRSAHLTPRTVVVVVENEAAGIRPGPRVTGDSFGRWSAVCHEHGTVYAGGVLGLVQRAARHPEEWCEECERAWARGGAS